MQVLLVNLSLWLKAGYLNSVRQLQRTSTGACACVAICCKLLYQRDGFMSSDLSLCTPFGVSRVTLRGSAHARFLDIMSAEAQRIDAPCPHAGYRGHHDHCVVQPPAVLRPAGNFSSFSLVR